MRFSLPTPKKFICKQCDAAVTAEKMPISAVTAHTRATTANSKSVCPVELCVLIRCIILKGQHMGKITFPPGLQKIKCHTKITLHATSAIIQFQRVHCYMLAL